MVLTNFRDSAFGFLGGKEVKAAGLGNIGLRDRKHVLILGSQPILMGPYQNALPWNGFKNIFLPSEEILPGLLCTPSSNVD